MAGSGTFFGVDLGTSSCSVAYVVDDPRQRGSAIVPVQTVDVPVDADHVEKRSNRMPSIVALGDDKRRKTPLFGWEFFQAFETRRKDSRLLSRGRDFFTSVKSDLGTERVYARSAVPGCQTPAQVTTLILQRLMSLAREGNSARDLRRSDVVLTVPASVGTLARKETREAAAAAGLDPARVELVDEPIAALLDLLNSPDAAHVLSDRDRHVLVFDYGGGTCDVALVKARFDAEKRTGLHVENLAISAYHRLGGDDVDAAVMAEVVWPQIAGAEERASLTAATRRLVEDTLTPTVARALKERMCRDVERWVSEQGWPAVDAAEVKVTAPLPREFVIPELERRTPHQFVMGSKQFRALMRAFLAPPTAERDDRSLLRPVMETLERAGLQPEDLDVVVLHGGSSLNPFVRRLLAETFRPGTLFRRAQIAVTPDPLASVARGAALACYWRRARAVEIVRPIMAEDLGVLVRSGEAVPLVRAGTPLPFPDDDSVREVTQGHAALFVPGDGLPEMIVPVYTGPERAPRLAGAVRVAVPPDTVAGTPVRVKLRVDRDKTLRWWFRLGEGEDVTAASVDDPWSARALTLEERRLLEHRRQMKALAARAEPITHTMLSVEANLLRRAGRLDDALLAAEACLAEAPQEADAHNIRGLILDEQGQAARAEEAFRAAASLAPTQAIYQGNLGAILGVRGKHDEAIAALRLAATLNPGLAYVHTELGDVFRRKGDEASARREYERGLELLNKTMEDRPFDVDSWRRLVRLHQSLGHYRQADEARRVAAELEAASVYEGDPSSVVSGRDRSAPVALPRPR